MRLVTWLTPTACGRVQFNEMPLFIRLNPRSCDASKHLTYFSLMNIVSNYIFDCNNRDANRAYVIFRENMAPVTTTGLGLLNATFTFKGTSPTNHFCMDS